MRLRARMYRILEVAGAGDRASGVFDIGIIILILLNIAAFVAQSVPSIAGEASGMFFYFEFVSVAIFSVEYAFRLWTCVENPAYSRPVAGRLWFAGRPLLIVDLLAVLPFYLPFLGIDLRVLRALRVLRLARIAKLGRYSSSLTLIYRVFREKKEEIITTGALMLVLLLFASSFMYYAERDAQPEVFGSIPQAMWWAAVTLTTVGYGDVYPVTAIGKVLGAVVAVLGIAMFALPTGILGAGFVEEIGKSKRRTNAGAQTTCPRCGHDIPAAGGQ